MTEPSPGHPGLKADTIERRVPTTGSLGPFSITASQIGPLSKGEIWDRDAADRVVYDNKMGSSDDSYEGTNLSGGNISVHVK